MIAVKRLKKGNTYTVLQFSVEGAAWIVPDPNHRNKAVINEIITIPAWSKIRFLGHVKKNGYLYPAFKVLRFDKVVDMDALDIVTPAIQTAVDFGRTFAGEVIVFNKRHCEFLDV